MKKTLEGISIGLGRENIWKSGVLDVPTVVQENLQGSAAVRGLGVKALSWIF